MKRVFDRVQWLVTVIGSASYKFYWDDCFSRAASLAYTTLFALVPLSALLFSMSGAFGLDEKQLVDSLQRFLEQVLPPNENEMLENLNLQVLDYVQLFGHTVRSLGAVSIGVLIFTGIALLNTIESALNAVWRVTSDSSVFNKISNFWTVITLGPLLFIVSFYWYGRVDVISDEFSWLASNSRFFDLVVPVTAIWFALTLMYFKLPATKVGIADAALGGLVASLLFEFAKRAFAGYISMSTTYSKFYGVLTSIPLFLFWLYLVWVVILFGAEISYQSGSIHVLRGLRKYATDLGEIGALLGLRLLLVIGERFVEGGPAPSEEELALASGSDPVLVRSCLQVLEDARLISVTDAHNHARALQRKPEIIKIADVLKAFHSKWYLSSRKGSENDPERYAFPLLDVVGEAGSHISRPLQDWTLAELLQYSQHTHLSPTSGEGV
jgi:YihY family inner membrane protein